MTFAERSETPQTYLDWREMQQPFQALAAIAGTQFRLKTEGASRRTRGRSASRRSSFPCCAWRRCSAAPSMPADEVEGRHRVAILTYGFWQRRFGGAPDVIGKTIELSETSYEIVGVMPRRPSRTRSAAIGRRSCWCR